MTSSELRIGNYVKDRGGKTLQIDWFEKDKVCMSMGTFEFLDLKQDLHPLTEYFEYLQPISLTEEILLKCGFEKGNNNWFNIKYFTDCDECVEEMKVDYNLISKRLSIYDAIEETDMVNILSHPIYVAKKIEYLHQLQNLYFALTNQELNINI